MNQSLAINQEKETEKIISFLQKTAAKQRIKNFVLGLSGGIDSTTSLFLLTKTFDPKNIFVRHLSYFPAETKELQEIIEQAKIPKENYLLISIQPFVETFKKELSLSETDVTEKMRLGNVMARIRMILLFDLAKKENAMVVGTENKSEYHLGYFTRFGDEASDIEPIRHLYKTQVYQLATYLHVPKVIINKKPTAGLWKNQTDEDEFGFTYEEADLVLSLFFDQKKPLKEIKKTFSKAEEIINRAKINTFKHHTPYSF